MASSENSKKTLPNAENRPKTGTASKIADSASVPLVHRLLLSLVLFVAQAHAGGNDDAWAFLDQPCTECHEGTFPGDTEAREHPNILFISIDDLRPELGCYGVEAVHSPNIDRLAETGVRFDRAYCQIAVCNPSRVSLLTGLRPDSAKVWTLDVRFRDTIPDIVTLPQHFKQHGYHAVSFGKIFHNPWPDNASWSEPHHWPKNSKLWSEAAKKQLADFRDEMRADGKNDAAIQRMRAPATEIVDYSDSEHIDGAIADQAIAAMKRLAAKEQPFFLAAGFIRPHLPFVVPRKYWQLYDREKIPLASNQAIARGAPDFALNTMYELRDYMDYSSTANPRNGSLTQTQQRELKHGYYASVSFIDAQIGRLLGELDSLGLRERTIVVLWSDHGWKLGEHNSWCKQTNYEIDNRVPLIIRDPRAAVNGRSTQSLVELVDLYPTLCDLAAIPAAKHLEGVSLAPILADPAKIVKSAAFSQFRRRTKSADLMGYTMRTDRYRYVEWIDRQTKKILARELYDHDSDPGESRNLAGGDAEKERVRRLSAQMWETLPKPPAFTGKSRPILRFRNKRSEKLAVFWLTEDGQRRKVGEIAPGRQLTQNTTKGHRFIVEGVETGFRKMVAVKQAEETVVLAAGKPKSGPNIVVIMGDDWSWPHAGILGDPVAETPNFDRIAREGVLFENAFVSAPSCTPSRFAIATGQYHWRLGEGANLGGSLAADIPVYPDLLAEAGYLTGYSRKGASPSKHTYRSNDPFGPRYQNFTEFLKRRKPGQSFCYWYGAGEPHRPYDWRASLDSDLDLSKIEIPACLPDNKTIRTDLGDYYLRVRKLDRLAGEILGHLENAGELENTIVVMAGDNGMPFPRCKATLYDMGTRTPLAIRWGANVAAGRKISDFVSLTDLAPTFLEAAGLPVPKPMTGRSLMPQLTSGKSGWIDAKRTYVLTGMERHVYPNPSRAVRTEQFLYIRNQSPETWPNGEIPGQQPRFDFTKTPWPTVSGAFSYNVDPSPTKQWMLENPNRGDRLNELAFGRRPDEELYDLRNDPHQLRNVANDPAFSGAIQDLRRKLGE